MLIPFSVKVSPVLGYFSLLRGLYTLISIDPIENFKYENYRDLKNIKIHLILINH